MHLVQFLLKVLHLLLDRRFAVKFLIIFLLSRLRCRLHISQLDSFPKKSFECMESRFLRILFQHFEEILFLIIHPGRHRCTDGPDGIPVSRKCTQHRLPLISFGKFKYALSDFPETLLSLCFIQVEHIRFSGHRHADIAVRHHNDFLDIHTVVEIHGNKTIAVRLGYAARSTDIVKAVPGKFAAGQLVFLEQNSYFISDRCGLAGLLSVELLTQP